LEGFADDAGDQAIDQYPVVHGQTSQVGDITLVGCWQLSRFPFGTKIMRPPVVVEYRANTAFLGAHFSNAEGLRFRKVSVRFSHLLEWINPRSIRGDSGQLRDGV
jgi:hypothetical protein